MALQQPCEIHSGITRGDALAAPEHARVDLFPPGPLAAPERILIALPNVHQITDARRTGADALLIAQPVRAVMVVGLIEDHLEGFGDGEAAQRGNSALWVVGGVPRLEDGPQDRELILADHAGRALCVMRVDHGNGDVGVLAENGV